MKIANFFLILLIVILSAGCKESATKTEETELTSVDSTSMPIEEPMAEETASPIMASMQEMMDRMHKMEKTGIADADLAMSTKEHHLSAIDMSNSEINSGSDAALKDMAKKMMEKQQKEVAELDGIIAKEKAGSKNYDPDNHDDGLGKAMMDNMMSMMKMPEAVGSTDKDFAKMMVKHHKDGIMMGQTILKYAKNTKFKSMTEKMIADQKKDITELENWLTSHK